MTVNTATMTSQETEWCKGFTRGVQSHVESNSLLDMVMPNGKRLGDCTGEECANAAELLERADIESFKLIAPLFSGVKPVTIQH